MNMRKPFVCFILLFLPLLEGKSQVYVFEGNDTTYLKQIEKFDNWSPEFWDWRDDLTKGSYYQISKHDCGVDTLREAHFSDSGIKDGVWINRWQSMCIAIDDDSISAQTFSKTVAFKNSETVYNKGFILKSTLYQLESALPLWIHHYPPNTTVEAEWNLSQVFLGEKMATETKITYDSTIKKKIQYFTVFDEQGQKFLQDQSDYLKKNKGKIIFYYSNGKTYLKGQYELNSKYRKNYNEYSFTGTWYSFDENGYKTARLKFKKGKLKKIKKLLKGFDESIITNQLRHLNTLPDW